MLQYPDVSATQIVFSYAGDLWLVPREGGHGDPKLSSPRGQELFPRFSPDGSLIGFNAAYDGNLDIYVVPATGGMPVRVTNHGMPDRLVDWYPDGKRLLFASIAWTAASSDSASSTRSPRRAASPTSSPFPTARWPASPRTGRRSSTRPRPRPSGPGNATAAAGRPISGCSTSAHWPRNGSPRATPVDEFPMWHGGTDLLPLRPRTGEPGEHLGLRHRRENDPAGHPVRRLRHPFPLPRAVGHRLRGRGKALPPRPRRRKAPRGPGQVVTDEITLRPRMENASGLIQWASRPDGKRAARRGPRRDLLGPGRERPRLQPDPDARARPSAIPPSPRTGNPSPIGATGPANTSSSSPTSRSPGPSGSLTSYGPGYRYQIYWSPDGKKIAFVDQAMEIHIFDVATGSTVKVDKCGILFQGGLRELPRQLVAGQPLDRLCQGPQRTRQRDLPLRRRRGQGPAGHVGLLHRRRARLRSGRKIPLFPDEPDVRPALFRHRQDLDLRELDDHRRRSPDRGHRPPPRPEERRVRDEEGRARRRQGAAAKDKGKDKDKAAPDKAEKPAVKDVVISLAGFENRIVDPAARPGQLSGRRRRLRARSSSTGSRTRARRTRRGPSFSTTSRSARKRRSSTTSDFFEVSADGTKVLVGQGGTVSAIVDVAEGQKMDKTMPTGRLEMTVDPRAEWRQIFNDVWRLETGLLLRSRTCTASIGRPCGSVTGSSSRRP